MFNIPSAKREYFHYPELFLIHLGVKKESFTSQICIPKQYSELYKTVSSYM